LAVRTAAAPVGLEERLTVSYDLSGTTAIVTGGSRGIGKAVAGRLSGSGSRVWVWDIAPIELEGTRSLAVDVTNADQVAGAITQILGQTSSIDILVNGVGHLDGFAPFERVEPAAWRRTIEVNLLSVFEVTRQVLKHMRLAGRGRIVNMGSLAGKEGLPNLSVYSAASAGVIAFTKSLAKEMANTDIRVNCVAPGPIETDLIKNLGADVVDSMIAASPMRRLGTVDEVAELVLWLCSDACTFNTGAVFDMSGGRATY
jgi:2-dehydro-3-deoxy-L-rhamnonate dehydrogenase (NAD+)